MFHGFVIFLEPEEIIIKSQNTELTTYEEIDYIKDMLGRVEVDTVLTPNDVYVGTEYIPVSKRKREKGITYKRKLLIREKHTFQNILSYDTTILTRKYIPTSKDTAVFAVLNRNLDWTKTIIVQDVTGSMYSYTLQTLVWLKLHKDNTDLKHFVFFNDGDNNPDGAIGKSDGAYYIQSKNIDDITNLISTVMGKRNGGMGPENDIEAILFAIKKYPDCESVILIADNSAQVRDMSLLKKINKPVKVILCGVSGMINDQYLEIAHKTGGSVHTIEQDIVDFVNLKNGDVLTIGEQKFKVKNNKFILID